LEIFPETEFFSGAASCEDRSAGATVSRNNLNTNQEPMWTHLLSHRLPLRTTSTMRKMSKSTLSGRRDAFGGLILNAENAKIETFEETLTRSIFEWKRDGTRGVWFKVPLNRAPLVPILVENGFVFHHAEPDYVMLNRFIPTDEINSLPPNASTQVGIGAIVLNPENQVLLVQEAVGPSSRHDMWKIPTGLVECGEDISDAAEREVMEEVGIAARFEKIVSMKHMHKAAFGKSDMFFTCILRCDDTNHDTFTLQSNEIARAKWDSYDTFLNQKPFPSEIPLWKEVYQQCVGLSGIVGDVNGLSMKRMDARNPLRKGDGRPDSAVLIY